MAKKVRFFDDIRLDVFEALKRTYIHRGLVPRKRPKETEPAEEDNNEELEPGPEELIDLTMNAHDILFRANTVFPFTLFPDTITLDREKLTIANRTFFWTAKIISVPVGAMLSAEADVGPFFGSVHMSSRYFVRNTYSVNFLTRGDAIKIQRLLQGYIIAHERKIDCKNIDKDSLKILLNDLGQGASD